MTAPKILVVDDDKTTVSVISAFLRQGGYDVSAAFDAMQGLSIAHRLTPALIVLDINMPAGGGARMLERLRQSGHTATIPVLVVTASLTEGLADQLLAQGAGRVLAKPVDNATLLDAASSLLGNAVGSKVPNAPSSPTADIAEEKTEDRPNAESDGA